MAVASIALSLLSLLLHVSETQAGASPTPKRYASMLSKRRFLSPKDLHGSYSRFLEVSENSTLCPNTIAHTTNGVLYPTGYIHIPLHHITQDGHTCLGPGQLVIRFRRKINSLQIEREFNITAEATGIDKMVRDILLSLDGFYFGRQTTQRKCHTSSLPSNTAFFFTSQAKPFAANVGVPFRRNPKIMFIVDNTRVCAFSGAFIQPPIALGERLVPEITRTPKAPVAPSPSQVTNSPAHPMGSENPGQPREEHFENEDSPSQQPKQHEHKKMPNTLGLPSGSSGLPIPSMPRKETKAPPQYNKPNHHLKDNIKSSTPLPMTPSDSLSKGRNGISAQHRDEKMKGQLDEDAISPSPSPSHLPQKTSHRPLGFPSKHSYETSRPSIGPSKSPTKNRSETENLTSTPSSSPTTKSYDILLPSATPRGMAHLNPSMKPPRPHPHKIVFTVDEISPSPSPLQLLNGEMNQSYSHFHGELHGSSPMMDAASLPEPSGSEMIIGDSVSTCFPSSATVMLTNGRVKRMDSLSVGTSVSVGNGKSSRIIAFSHFDRRIVSAFLHLHTDSGQNLTVTPSHFVYTDRGLVPAARIASGDYLKLYDGRPTRVVSVSRIHSQGLFNPHSLHGDLVVDGFIVSTYTLAAAPMTAHALLTPIRFLYESGFRTSIVLELSKCETIVGLFRALLSSNPYFTRL